MRILTAPLLVPPDGIPVFVVVPSLGSSLAFLCAADHTIGNLDGSICGANLVLQACSNKAGQWPELQNAMAVIVILCFSA